MAAPRKKRSKLAPSGIREAPASNLVLPGTFPIIKTPDDFREAGLHIFGGHGWTAKTSRCMGVAESTIWRWVNEQTAIKSYALAVMSAWLHIFLTTGERPPEVPSDDD